MRGKAAGNNGFSQKFSSGGGGNGRSYDHTSPKGGDGTCFSGGSGTGAAWLTADSNAPSDYGGPGSNGAGTAGGGGAGNPGGLGSGVEAQSGESGTGGLLLIFAKNLSGNGIFESKGSAGGYGKEEYHDGTGGSSGGGIITILYSNLNSFSGVLDASGGHYNVYGGSGGAGSIIGPIKIDQ